MKFINYYNNLIEKFQFILLQNGKEGFFIYFKLDIHNNKNIIHFRVKN